MQPKGANYDEKFDSENQLDQTLSRNVGEVQTLDPHHDAVFGDIGEDGPNYRDVCNSISDVLFSLTFIRLDGLEPLP